MMMMAQSRGGKKIPKTVIPEVKLGNLYLLNFQRLK